MPEMDQTTPVRSGSAGGPDGDRSFHSLGSHLLGRQGINGRPYFFLKSPAVTTESRFGSMCLRIAALTDSGLSSLICCSSSAWNRMVRPT